VHLAKRVLVVLGILILLAAVGLYVASILMINNIFNQRVERFETTPEKLGLEAQVISLTSSDGIPLKAWWVPLKEDRLRELRGTVILLHGMDGMDASSMLGHSKFLHEEGYVTIALDMRAHGQSGGKRIGLGFEEWRDVSAALDWVGQLPELREKPVVLLGVSMGGAVAIRTAAMRSDVDAVISVSSFASVDRMIQNFMVGMGAPRILLSIMPPFIQLGIKTVYGVWPIVASPLHDIPQISPQPVFIIHGTADDQVPVEHAYLLAEAIGGNGKLWIVQGGEHCVFQTIGLTTPLDQVYKEQILRFLDGIEVRRVSPPKDENLFSDIDSK